VVRAVVKIGRIPTYNNPDPKDLNFTTHREIIYKVFDWLVYGLIFFVVLFLISISAKKIAVKKIHLILLMIGVVAVLFHLFLDPFDTWFLD
jgi:hypothetical protein